MNQRRVALVTGASRGIGREIALGLADRGFDVVANDIARQADLLLSLVAEINAKGRRGFAVHADVSDKNAVTAMVRDGIETAGQIDAVVNNAGILITSPVATLDEGVWDAVMDVNAKGTFLVIQALLPHMRERRYGRIVIGGKQGAPEQAPSRRSCRCRRPRSLFRLRRVGFCDRPDLERRWRIVFD